MSDNYERAQRVPVCLDVALEAEEAHYVVESENLSETGILLRTKRAFPQGTPLRMVFGHPPELPKVRTFGVVRRLENGKSIGVVFTSLGSEERKAILDFVNSHHVN